MNFHTAASFNLNFLQDGGMLPLLYPFPDDLTSGTEDEDISWGFQSSPAHPRSTS